MTLFKFKRLVKSCYNLIGVSILKLRQLVTTISHQMQIALRHVDIPHIHNKIIPNIFPNITIN